MGTGTGPETGTEATRLRDGMTASATAAMIRSPAGGMMSHLQKRPGIVPQTSPGTAGDCPVYDRLVTSNINAFT